LGTCNSVGATQNHSGRCSLLAFRDLDCEISSSFWGLQVARVVGVDTPCSLQPPPPLAAPCYTSGLAEGRSPGGGEGARKFLCYLPPQHNTSTCARK